MNPRHILSIGRRFSRSRRRILVALLCLVPVLTASVYHLVPPPAAVDRASPWRPAEDLRWFSDETWLDPAGQRQDRQTIFDAIFGLIADAHELLLIDMFLFNEWQGPAPETRRALADELVAAILQRVEARPALQVIVISDPINTVYGGLASEHFDRLRAGGVEVVLTRLSALQDSNPLWSALWRVLIRPWGNSDEGGWLPNPLGPGKVTLRSYLALANFKANHRKLVVADDANRRLTALITSANPHDGSSAHRNVALQFSGQAVRDLLASEQDLLAMSGAPGLLPNPSGLAPQTTAVDAATDVQMRILTEQAIQRAVLESLAQLGPGDRADLYMFYLSDREVVQALSGASARGVQLRVLLDRNLDAFGRQKNGVPNKPVAAELTEAGIPVRWCATLGEQCHAKLLIVAREATGSEASPTEPWCCRLILGSANFTRRNLDNYNLETDVMVQGTQPWPVWQQAADEFEAHWTNRGGRQYSLDYAEAADERDRLVWQYRLMEATGLSTF